jgi:hypothetical protein
LIGDYNDWHGRLTHDFFQKRQTIHPGHFNIQGNDVGPFFLNFLYRYIRITCGSDYTNFRIALKQGFERLPYHGGIVDNQNFNYSHRCYTYSL